MRARCDLEYYQAVGVLKPTKHGGLEADVCHTRWLAYWMDCTKPANPYFPQWSDEAWDFYWKMVGGLVKLAVCECYPDCTSKECGHDGCGGSCGECGDGQFCMDGGCKDVCESACAGKQCGTSGDDGECDCGECSAGMLCVSGMCENATCIPSCKGKECGSDGCGDDTGCGGCLPGSFCSPFFQCTSCGAGCWADYENLMFEDPNISELLSLTASETGQLFEIINELEVASYEGDLQALTEVWDEYQSPAIFQLDPDEATLVFLRRIAVALWNEVHQAFPWSLKEFTDEKLKLLLAPVGKTPGESWKEVGCEPSPSAYSEDVFAVDPNQASSFVVCSEGEFWWFDYQVWATNPLAADALVKEAWKEAYPLLFSNIGPNAKLGAAVVLYLLRDFAHAASEFDLSTDCPMAIGETGCHFYADCGDKTFCGMPPLHRDVSPGIDPLAQDCNDSQPVTSKTYNFEELMDSQVAAPGISAGLMRELARALNLPFTVGQVFNANGKCITGGHAAGVFWGPGTSGWYLMDAAHPWEDPASINNRLIPLGQALSKIQGAESRIELDMYFQHWMLSKTIAQASANLSSYPGQWLKERVDDCMALFEKGTVGCDLANSLQTMAIRNLMGKDQCDLDAFDEELDTAISMALYNDDTLMDSLGAFFVLAGYDMLVFEEWLNAVKQMTSQDEIDAAVLLCCHKTTEWGNCLMDPEQGQEMCDTGYVPGSAEWVECANDVQANCDVLFCSESSEE